ncbi:MAG: hypothetical protein ACKOYM_10545 [Actinomycetes bacterium]
MTRHRHDRGVAEVETLIGATLVILCTTLVLVAAWGVVEVRTAVDEAAREYLRTYTESNSADAGDIAARRAAAAVLIRRGTPLRRVVVTPPNAATFGPCAVAQVRLTASVAAVRLPFGLRFGAVTVSTQQEELVDAHRELRTGNSYRAAATPCFPA